MAVVNNLNPKLIVEPTIIASPDANLPRIDLPEYGDPFGRVGPSSNGPGSGGGIGTGSRGGVGSGDGPGVGPGKNGGYGGEVFAIGGSVSAPILIDKVEPEYSEEARKAKYQGTVNMEVVIDEKGHVVSLRVISSPGLGLDIKASEAVRLWRFRPGTRNGKPVAVSASVAVNFRLL
jgi:TonB family protein